MTTLITEIAKFHSTDLDEAGARLELSHADYPADRLIIKRAGPNQVSVALRPSKYSILDPEAVLLTGGDAWAPVAFTSPTLGLDVMAATLNPDGSVKRCNPAQQANITRHVETFAAQIQAQNWLEKGQKLNTTG
jgi:hypothetical protein